jgi:hypothetical protein
LANRVRYRHTLPLQDFNLTQLRYNVFRFLAFASHLLVLLIKGYSYPSCRTTFSGAYQPLCLHKASREVIASSPRSYLLKTTEKNQQMMVGFADRAEQMLPYGFEGFGLLMERGCITVAESGRIQTVPKKVRKAVSGTAETVECQKAARIVGREFARIGDRATISATFGVRP